MPKSLPGTTDTTAPDEVIIRGGHIYDGSGTPAVTGDVAIAGDRIVAVGHVRGRGAAEIDARGLAVSPGFINMLSWANVSLLADGRSMSDIKQGVTLEVLGEGSSMGPLNETMRQGMLDRQGDIKFDVPWTTLGEYLDHLVTRGVACNVASFVGATTVRVYVIGYADRLPTPDELAQMRGLVSAAMREGAVGVSSALIYAPASYSDTNEMIALASAAAASGGMYISHIRSEDAHIDDALEEFVSIARASGARSEIYHLKVSGRANWARWPHVIARIERARETLPITADMYTYPASSTGLDSTLPGWAHEGGHRALIARLSRPDLRAQIAAAITLSAPPDQILLVGLKQAALKPLIGKSLAEVAEMRGQSPEETIMELIVEDDSRVSAVFFSMAEENVRKQVALPWVSFGSDGASLANEDVFLQSSTHPRAYGTFARLLGKYVREEQIIPLQDAIRRLTALPAANLRLDRRGLLRPGYFADIAVFDPTAIRDLATFEQPHCYAEGMVHLFVNGVQVLRDGTHTGATPGRVVRGPGWIQVT